MPVTNERVTVTPSEEMTQQILRMHIQKRHARLGFWSRGEHDADHRLHDSQLDHTHQEGDEA